MHQRILGGAGLGPRPLAPALAAAGLLLATNAAAEEGGRLIGTVKDVITQAPLKGVVVIATSPALQGEEMAVTDAHGHYHFEGNLFNFQAETRRNERYTQASLERIPGGGTKEDLPRKNSDGSYTCSPPQCKLRYFEGPDFDAVDVNPEFGQPLAYQAPRSFRLSARVDF